MVGTLVRYRGLVGAFAQRELRTRYRSSALGWAWSLLQPLANLAIFSIVFSVVFRVPAPPMGDGAPSYVLFLFTGLVAWGLFSNVIILSMVSLRASGDLLRKVYFPAFAPVLGATSVQFVQTGLELAVLLGWMVVVGNVGWTWLATPFILAGLFLFAQGVGLGLSILNARFGDVQYIVTVLLGALWFLTPALYPVSAIPASATVLKAFVTYQPVSWYVTALHDSLYTLQVPGPLLVSGLVGFGFVVFVAGFWAFDRWSEDVGELL